MGLDLVEMRYPRSQAVRREGKVTQLDVRSWADGDKGVRTWCLGISSTWTYQRQGLRKRWGDPLTQGGSIMGKALGDEASPCVTCHIRNQGKPLSRPRGGGEGPWQSRGSRGGGGGGGGAEHALSRPPLGEQQSRVSDWRLTAAGPPALSPRGLGLWGAWHSHRLPHVQEAPVLLASYSVPINWALNPASGRGRAEEGPTLFSSPIS